MTVWDSLEPLLEREHRFFGKYRGVVTDNADDKHRGLIKAEVPAVFGDTESGWLWPCVPYAGDDAGFFALPPIGAGVWVEFEGGDPSLGIWSGTWWGEGTAPTGYDSSKPEPGRKILKSETGLVASLDDDTGTIAIADAGGNNLIEIASESGQITITASTKVTIEAPLIHHGASAGHPHVFGDDLMTYLTTVVNSFNAHTHPGQTAAGVLPVMPMPPVAPLTPPNPSMLSSKNLLE